ncbi:MAG: helix repeat-containing protein [Frankiales bacterium]|nr:helix repeat-containing protein [Frankiales bacterium]
MTVLAIDYEGGFETAFQDGIALLPKVGYFLLILIVGYFLAKAVAKILTKVLQKVGFDDLVERGGVKQALSKSRYDAAAILGRIVFYFIFLLVLSAAFGVFGADNPISAFLREIIAYLPRLFVAILIVVIAAAVASAVKEIVGSALGGLSYGTSLATAVSLFIVAIGAFAALDQLEIAPVIVTSIFVALVALIVLPLIIAFGVGGIDPAREAIRSAQAKGQQKVQEVRQEVSSSDEQVDLDEPVAPAVAARRTRTAAATGQVRRRRPTA